MLSVSRPRQEKDTIGKLVKICLLCGSDSVDILEFAISCEECGSLLRRR